MLILAKINETMIPDKRRIPLLPAIMEGSRMISTSVAANNVGMARMNENSTMVLRGIPSESPPRIVAADREVPGIRAMDWNNPMITDCRGQQIGISCRSTIGETLCQTLIGGTLE